MKRFFKWLIPGLKVKRWLLLATAGILVLTLGLTIIADIRVDFSLIFADISSTVFTGAVISLLGIILIIIGFRRTVRSIISTMMPANENKLVEVVYQKRHLKRGPKIVVIGGGTGLSVLLRGLKYYTSNITAIVTVSDDGGSSGRLRGELGVLPPGDTRNCLVALADTETLMDDLFNYRFNEGVGLKGHSMGNLLLAAMNDLTGDFDKAVQELSKVLAIRGRVIPSTLESVTLGAKLVSGKTILGESCIGKANGNIKKVFLEPADCKPLPEAIEAIEEADMVILGPGSLYTSVIPNLLIEGIGKALKETKAPVAYICNVMTQPGETQNYTAYKHLKALLNHGGQAVVDYMIVNNDAISPSMLKKYRAEGAAPVKVDEKLIKKSGVKLIKTGLIDQKKLVRHDSDKIARVIVKLIFKLKSNPERLKLFDIYLIEKLRELSE